MMDCRCIKFFSIELRVSLSLLQHLNSSWYKFLHHCNNLALWAVLLLSLHICLVCLLLSLTAQTLSWPLMCIGHAVIVLSLLWLNTIGFLQIWFWDSLVIPKLYRYVFLDEFHSSLLACHFGARKVCPLFSGRIWWPNILLSCKQAVVHCAIYRRSPLLSLNQVFCSYYLFQKASFHRVYIEFFMDLPFYDKHNAFFACFDKLTKYYRLITCFVGEGALSASSVAKLFFDNIVRFFGVPT